MDLDEVMLEVLTEYEVELTKRDFRELISLCFEELENEGEIPESILQLFFSDLDIEAPTGLISEIIYRVNEAVDEHADDVWNLDGDGEEA